MSNKTIFLKPYHKYTFFLTHLKLISEFRKNIVEDFRNIRNLSGERSTNKYGDKNGNKKTLWWVTLKIRKGVGRSTPINIFFKLTTLEELIINQTNQKNEINKVIYVKKRFNKIRLCHS